MLDPSCIDTIAECVKDIVNSNRCISCDKLDGPRLRWPCGHTFCNDCINTDCSLCLSSEDSSYHAEPVLDVPLTERIKHASLLLETCQNVLHVDVFKRHRISEQRKVEKELFPECIQAPIKYFNRKKSFSSKLGKKENKKKSRFLGEEISTPERFKMNHSNFYVQQWLDQQQNQSSGEAREPFSDINTNIQKHGKKKYSPIKKRSNTSNLNTKNKVISRKTGKNKSNLNKIVASTPYKAKSSIFSMLKDEQDLDMNKESHHVAGDESGIVVDDTIFIDDSQSDEVDKDKLAQLAVLDAEKHSSTKYLNQDNSQSDGKTIFIDNSQSEEVDKDKLAQLVVLDAEKHSSGKYLNRDNSQSVGKSIFIEDSVNEEVDKDKLAQLAVLEAENRNNKNLDQHNSKSVGTSQENRSYNNKVPFYKKSFITGTCECSNVHDNDVRKLHVDTLSDVSITIESSSFITNISVTNADQKSFHKVSVSTQTNLSLVNIINQPDSIKNEKMTIEHESGINSSLENKNIEIEKENIEEPMESKCTTKTNLPSHSVSIDNKNSEIEKENIEEPTESMCTVIGNLNNDYDSPKINLSLHNSFVDNRNTEKENIEKPQTQRKCTVIDDSDSDYDSPVINIPSHIAFLENENYEIEKENIKKPQTKRKFTVINDADNDYDLPKINLHSHRSVLVEIDHKDLHKMSRPHRRGYTPNSSDSSEKENFEPNRIKRPRLTNKKKKC